MKRAAVSDIVKYSVCTFLDKSTSSMKECCLCVTEVFSASPELPIRGSRGVSKSMSQCLIE